MSLLHRLERQELNCYMYAPKDELKHRLLWREPYTEHEAGSGSAGPHHGWAVASQSSQVTHGLHLSQGQAGCYCSSCQKPAPRPCPSQGVPLDPTLPMELPVQVFGNMLQCARACRPLWRVLCVPALWTPSPHGPSLQCSFLTPGVRGSFHWQQSFPLHLYLVSQRSQPSSALSPARMRSLIEAAQMHGVEFIFAISAGQDMVFSSAGDRLLLQQKLRQVPWAIPSSHGSQASSSRQCCRSCRRGTS